MVKWIEGPDRDVDIQTEAKWCHFSHEVHFLPQAGQFRYLYHRTYI